MPVMNQGALSVSCWSLLQIHLWLIMPPGPLGVLSLQLDISEVLSVWRRQWDVMSRGWEFIIHAKKVLVADHLVTSLHIQIHKNFPWHLTWRVILTLYHQPTPTISTMRSKSTVCSICSLTTITFCLDQFCCSHCEYIT